VLGIKGRDGAFAEYLSLPARNLIELPDSVPNDSAVFIEPLAAACNILEQVTITSSSEVAVVGDGKLAQLVVMVIGQIGCPLLVIGRHTSKLERARGYGANRVLLDAPGLRDELRARFDVVVEASGEPSGLGTALTLAKPRGTVILKSTHHQTTPLDLSQIVVNELTIVGSRCGRFHQALDLVSGASLDLAALIGRKFPLEEGLRAFEAAAAPETMKVILQME
jgi:threonine dehydrogenase-like Zn-dependent dehydrogenase